MDAFGVALSQRQPLRGDGAEVAYDREHVGARLVAAPGDGEVDARNEGSGSLAFGSAGLRIVEKLRRVNESRCEQPRPA